MVIKESMASQGVVLGGGYSLKHLKTVQFPPHHPTSTDLALARPSIAEKLQVPEVLLVYFPCALSTTSRLHPFHQPEAPPPLDFPSRNIFLERNASRLAKGIPMGLLCAMAS